MLPAVLEKCSWTQILLLPSCAGNECTPCPTKSFCCRFDGPRQSEVISILIQFEEEEITSAYISHQDLGCKMLLSDWEINVFFVFWEPRKQIAVSTTGMGDYLSFITICLDLDLTRYYYPLHLPRLMEKKKSCLEHVVIFAILCNGRGKKKAVRCISTQHLCPSQEKSLPFTRLLQASSFFLQSSCMLQAPLIAQSPTLFSFLHVLQAETDGNLKLLASAPGSD